MKKILSLLLVMLMLISASACGTKTTEPVQNETAATEPAQQVATTEELLQTAQTEPAEIAEDVTYKKSINIGIEGNVSSIDVHTNSNSLNDYFNFMVYNQLISFDWDSKEIKPELAESWEVEDASNYLFHLRKDVYFSNGEQFTADDVQFSFIDRPAMVEATTMGKVTGLIDSIEIIDDFTLRIKLNTPNADFLSNIYVVTGSIMNREAVEADPTEGHFIGTAGWIIDDWQVNGYVHCVKNVDSWVWKDGGETPTEEVTFKCMPEASSRAIALQNHEIDTSATLADADLPSLVGDESIESVTYLMEKLYFYMFNMRSGKFANDENLRNAVAFAIKYQDMLDLFTSGKGQLTNTMWGLNQFGFYDDFDEKVEYNVDKAKEYLAKSSAPNGLDVEIIVGQAMQSLAPLMQSNLRDIGINAKITLVDTAGFNAAVADGVGDIYFFNITQRTDGDRFSFIPDIANSTNRAHYDNPEMLQQFIDARSTSDDATRLEIYKDIQIKLNNDKPYIPLFVGTANTGWVKGVSGIKFSPDGKHDYTFIRCAE